MKARGLIAVAIAMAGGLGASIFLIHRQAHSADHLDSPATQADPTSDINDVYTWMDTGNVVLAMTLYPNAPSTALFSDATQYVFHTGSAAAYGTAPAATYDIICTFSGTTAPQTITCWGGTNEYVTGNASATTGLVSADSKFKVFAGLRADPFFFNLDGFHAATETVANATGLTFNDAGCPLLDPGTAGALVGDLTHNPADGGAANDFFAPFNALAIVVSIDKSLVSSGTDGIVSVWGGTYK
jgi:hypothetical protein